MSETEGMNRNGLRRSALVLGVTVILAVLSVSGCMVGPNYHPPETTAPTEWAGVTKTPTDQPAVATEQPSDITQWWQQFKDPTLTKLVQEALDANLDMQIAQANLRAARAMRDVAIGGLWPSVTIAGAHQLLHKVGGAAEGQDLYEAGLDAVWELDFFGNRRRNVEAATATVQAGLEGTRATQVSLVAEVALDYIQLRGYQQEIVIAQNNLKAQQATADITRKLFNVGFSSGLDVANADSTVATTESQIPGFEISAQQSIYALSILLARPPAALLEQLSPFGSLPNIPRQVPAGLPSDLLRRRPDIRQSEAQLHAATAQIGVAVSDFFPTFSLTGVMNWNSNLLHTWWTQASSSYFFGPAVTWPIFQGGAIAANVRLQEALRDQAFLTYQKTVLGAFQDVENALIAFGKEQERRKALYEAVIANRKAVDLSLQLYSVGQTDFLNVATAQRSLYASEDSLIQSESNIATDLVALYKALGGGWQCVSLPCTSPDFRPGECCSGDKTQ